jgi:uncharacterized cupredoxin-like copper-binding protein
MKPFVPGRLLAVVFFALSIGAASAATSGVQVIHVSLEGEAGQPMSIKLDAQQAKAGVVEFDVKNDAISTDHEVVLVKLRKKADVISADAKTHRVDEHKLKSMGEVAGLKPGQDGKLTVKLPAGDYVLLCNHKEHYELGMATPFTVVR